jgi:hypothetical protein
MSIKVSYKELLRDGYTNNQCVQLLELPHNALIETYLKGVSTNNIIRAKPSTNNFTKIVLSPCHLMFTTPSLRLLLIMMPTPFLIVVMLVYHSLKQLSSISFTVCPLYFVS